MSNLRNLRNRPFLIIESAAKPQKGVNTEKKGWAANASNFAIFERPSIVDRVKDKTLISATVIIDIMSGTMVKNRFDHVTDQEVIEHYLTKYRDHVTEAMDIWLTRQAQNTDFAALAKEAVEKVRAEAAAKEQGVEEIAL